jgi:hypothetical protein
MLDGAAALLGGGAVVSRLKHLIVYVVFRFRLLRWWFAAEVRALVLLDKAGGYAYSYQARGIEPLLGRAA